MVGALTQDAELTPADPANNEYFGDALAVSGSTVVVGAPGVGDAVGGRAGAAYVFQEPAGGWSGTITQSAGLTPPSGAEIDELGGSVAVSGNTVAVGAPLETVGPERRAGRRVRVQRARLGLVRSAGPSGRADRLRWHPERLLRGRIGDVGEHHRRSRGWWPRQFEPCLPLQRACRGLVRAPRRAARNWWPPTRQ